MQGLLCNKFFVCGAYARVLIRAIYAGHPHNNHPLSRSPACTSDGAVYAHNFRVSLFRLLQMVPSLASHVSFLGGWHPGQAPSTGLPLRKMDGLV